MRLVTIHADESCLGNGQGGQTPGGAGGLITVHTQEGLVRRDFWVCHSDTTNNRMAILSAIKSLEYLSRKGQGCRIVFTSDSNYLVRGMSEWIKGWMAKGWVRTGEPIPNAELWQELVGALGGHEVYWRWVKGHDGHPQNEYANFLATRAAATQTESGGTVESGYDGWLAAERQKGRCGGAEDAFPTAETFRANTIIRSGHSR